MENRKLVRRNERILISVTSLCVVIVFTMLAAQPKLMSDVFVMQAAMPAMTNTSIVAKVYGGDYKYAAMLTVVSTLLVMSQGLTDSSFKYHLESAKKNGVTKTEMAEILTYPMSGQYR